MSIQLDISIFVWETNYTLISKSSENQWYSKAEVSDPIFRALYVCRFYSNQSGITLIL